MGRMVTAALEDVVIVSDATQDIWSIIAVTPNRVKLHGFELTSNVTVAAILSITLKRITAVGSGGAALADELLDDTGNTANTATVRTEDTTPGTPGGNLMGFQWEQLGPLSHVFTPEARPIADITDGFALVLNTGATPTLSGWLTWEEV